MSTSYILINILLGAVGLAYMTYGKQQKRAMPLLSGLSLLVMPYFISNITILIFISIITIVLPFIVKV